MKHRSLWTDEDDAAIRALMPASDEAIAAALGRSKRAVCQRRMTIGLRLRPTRVVRLPADDDNWQAKAAIASKRLLDALRGVQ